MLDRFIENEYRRYVTYSLHSLQMDITGQLTSTVDGGIINFDTDDNITINFIDGERSLSKAFLMALTFKPVFDSYSFILDWNVLYIDGNIKNTHPSNLIWQPPLGGQKCPEDERFFVVPGFSRHGVNEEGVFYNRFTNKVLKSRNSGGYRNVSAYLDNGEYTVLGVHRAMGLALLEYPAEVNDLTINHLNGVKHHNYKSNIEWATYSENNTHAMDTGLKINRRPCELNDYINDIILTFKSVSDAASYLGISSGALVTHHRRNPMSLIQLRYSFRYEDEKIEWPVFSAKEMVNFINRAEIRKENKDCVARNVFTNETFIAETPGQLAKIIGFTKDEIWTAIDSPFLWPTKNFICYFMKSPKPTPSFSFEELTAFKDRTGIRSPVEIIYKNGGKQVFISARELSKILGADIRFVESRLMKKDIFETSTYTVRRLTPKLTSAPFISNGN